LELCRIFHGPVIVKVFQEAGNMRTTVIPVAAALALLVAGSTAEAGVTERQFVSGGTVRLELDAGEYEIVGSRDDRIRVTWDDGQKDTDVSLRIDVKASRATVRTDTPWNDGARIRIELPRRTNIVLRLSAGDLEISGIEGSKDISAHAGDVTIDVGSRDQYRYATASVRVGELNADAFNVHKDGLFRSFEWTGKGKYELRAHLTVGDLKLDN
jgi:hypothetical protein